MNTKQPIKRSKIRVFIGRKYFTFKRHLYWYLSKKEFAKKTINDTLPHIQFSHKTPLLRQLKDVDMYLQHNKVINLKIASKCLNGLIVHPGETFSYWKLIGKPSKFKGYVDGVILENGRYKTGIGGGLCQLSNLIYWMALHTPMEVVEIHRHSYDVFPDSNRTQPFGSGATCVYNYRDLQIYNSTSTSFQLKVYLDDNFLFGEWRTTEDNGLRFEIYEKNHRISHEFWGGYIRRNEIYKKTFYNDTLISDELVVENNALMMYSPFLEEKTQQ